MSGHPLPGDLCSGHISAAWSPTTREHRHVKLSSKREKCEHGKQHESTDRRRRHIHNASRLQVELLSCRNRLSSSASMSACWHWTLLRAMSLSDGGLANFVGISNTSCVSTLMSLNFEPREIGFEELRLDFQYLWIRQHPVEFLSQVL